MLTVQRVRRTLRRLGQSAAGLAVVPTAGLPEGDAEPEVAGGDEDPPGQRDVRLEEVLDGAGRAAPAVSVHVPTIKDVSKDGRVKTSHGELTLEQIAELLPGTGELMQSIGKAWWKCAYAARGGNWDLAAHFARRTRGLLRKLAIVRPKYQGDVAAFEEAQLARVLAACETNDLAVFEQVLAASIARANELHGKWGKSYIRWVLPDEPPSDLELTP